MEYDKRFTPTESTIQFTKLTHFHQKCVENVILRDQ